MKKILLFVIPILYSCMVSAQTYNDTIVYKSGMVKVVEITEFNNHTIYYNHINTKGDSTQSQVKMGVVRTFRSYDQEGILEYDMLMAGEIAEQNFSRLKYPDSVSVAPYTLSINPFLLPFLCINGKYQYHFGQKMQWAAVGRFTLLTPMLTPFGPTAIFGGAMKFAPFHNKRFSFGTDLGPIVIVDLSGGSDISVAMPLSIDFDFHFTNQFGFSFDFGTGPFLINDFSDLFVRGHAGLLFTFGQKQTFATNYR